MSAGTRVSTLSEGSRNTLSRRAVRRIFGGLLLGMLLSALAQ